MQIRIYALKFGTLYLSNSMRIVKEISPPYPLSMWTPEWDLSGSPPLSSLRMDLLTFQNPLQITTLMYSPHFLKK